MKILECGICGFVSLETKDHITPEFYQESGMHGSEPVSMEQWLKKSAEDDQRRYKMLERQLPNKRILDFGCGAAGFIDRAQSLAAEVTGVELEKRVQEYWSGSLKIVSSLDAAGVDYDLINGLSCH
jgi:cyclopropane fatty-acyl-phospholipid synthase-like methyltransferase